MFNRRTFLSLAAGSITAPRLASAREASRKVALYANVGADLTHYDVDVASAELIKRETVTLPAGVNMLVRTHRDVIYTSRSAVALPVMAGAGTDMTSPRLVSISQLRSQPARSCDTAADAPYPHQHGHSVENISSC